MAYGPTPWCPSGESAGNPDALGDYFGGPEPNSFGLFQVYYPVHFEAVGPDPYRLLDPVFNVEIAYGIYADAERYWGQPWRPWTCRPFQYPASAPSIFKDSLDIRPYSTP